MPKEISIAIDGSAEGMEAVNNILKSLTIHPYVSIFIVLHGIGRISLGMFEKRYPRWNSLWQKNDESIPDIV